LPHTRGGEPGARGRGTGDGRHCPHTRGGEPTLPKNRGNHEPLSPHTWG